jgi:hypothetical protein
MDVRIGVCVCVCVVTMTTLVGARAHTGPGQPLSKLCLDALQELQGLGQTRIGGPVDVRRELDAGTVTATWAGTWAHGHMGTWAHGHMCTWSHGGQGGEEEG